MKTTQKLMFIGKTYSGKTTLVQYLNNKPLIYKKTQAIEIINSQLIDTPGEFLEQRSFTGALMVTSYEADVILLLQAADDEQTMFPPAFNTIFNKTVIGIVTKIDLVSEEQIAIAKDCLKKAGANKIFLISVISNQGVDSLIEYLECDESESLHSELCRDFESGVVK